MTSTIQTVLQLLRPEMGKMRVPRPADKVHKDECVLSFDSPFSEDGLFVNLITYQGFGKAYLPYDKCDASNKFYLQEIWRQVPKADAAKAGEAAPTKLAIGVTGGFATEEQFDLEKTHFLVACCADGSTHSIPLPCAELPEFVNNVIQGIIDQVGMKSNLQTASWEADNQMFVSKYAADLVQSNPTGKKISQDPATWVDEETGEAGNLWLNLSTGYIGGGRRNWDGSGGSGSALRHYEETGKRYPLAVKLGTITPHSADVWSYAADEDAMVQDPKLAEHLSFWGIDIMRMEKTEKTVGEMDVDLNMSYDWSAIMEGEEKLEPRSGPGLLGLTNIGSSCYLNSIMQCMLSLPEVQQRYFGACERVFASTPRDDPSMDFVTQLSKLAVALCSDRYVPPVAPASKGNSDNSSEPASDSVVRVPGARDERYNLAPRMFKYLVGKGHPEFSSGRQQDASEYFMHLLDVMNKAERTGLSRMDASAPEIRTGGLFEFHIQDRLHDPTHNLVRYTPLGRQTLHSVLELRIPLERGTQEQKGDGMHGTASSAEKRPRVDLSGVGSPAKAKGVETPPDAHTVVGFDQCLQTAFEPEAVQVTLNPAMGPAVCQKRAFFRTFPRYLMVKLGRYTAGANWVQVKVNAKVPVPEHLDLSSYRGTGLCEGEIEAPVDIAPEAAVASSSAAAHTESDETLVMQLVSMGFSENGCKRAAVATQNSGVEEAMNWVLTHMEDADFNDPLPAPGAASVGSTAGGGGGAEPDPEAVAMLSSMGYTERQVHGALRATSGSIERAADWLFSHTDGLDAAVEAALNEGASSSTDGAASGAGGEQAALEAADDGRGQYTLVAVISHIGKNTDHGHYVCHIRKHGEWVLFNDEKVGACSAPPLEHGFMYLFRRDDGSGVL